MKTVELSKEKLINFIKSNEFAYVYGAGRMICEPNDEDNVNALVEQVESVSDYTDCTSQLIDNEDDSVAAELKEDMQDGCHIIQIGGTQLFIAYF